MFSRSSDDAGPTSGNPGYIKGFLGGVVADEPRAALVGREVLSAGGTAADAAVAVGFALAVTLPSRAGLGASGACLSYAASPKGANKGVPEAILFIAPPPAAPGNADRPAAAPMLARGMFALHAKYGTRRFESLMAPAEQMARFGVPASRALVRDLNVVAGPLAADPAARAVFFPDGHPLAEGAQLIQPGLGGTLAQLRTAGVGDLYQGALAHLVADAARDAGGGLTAEDLRRALAAYATPLSTPTGHDIATFLPPPADGGLAADAAFRVLEHDPSATAAAQARALAVAARWRQGGGDPAAILGAADLPGGSLPALPASTSFATLDRDGNAVVCALSMNNLFGTGRIAAGTGVLLAASPASIPPPLLTAALVYNANQHSFRALVGASGQEAAPLAAALSLVNALADPGPLAKPLPVPPPDPGRVNVIECPRYMSRTPGACGWATDPRGGGLAVGSSG